MSDKVKFLMTFRARLMLLLTSFLIITIVLVLFLDNLATKRTAEEVQLQSEQVKAAVSGGLGDLAVGMGIAINNLGSDKFLYEIYAREQLPATIEHIIVTDDKGEVKDTTLPDQQGRIISLPDKSLGAVQEQDGDPVDSDLESEPHDREMKTYSISFETTKGNYWIFIVQNQGGILNKIDEAQATLAARLKQLSDIRFAITTGLLALALAIAVVIGWRFTQPIKELAAAAQRVAAGDLDFRVRHDRADEVGQLATTFNEMIAGLKSKRELEEKLTQAERAAVIGRMTQAVAHEIRNPLNVINLSIDHASKRYAPEDETKRKQFTRMLSSIKDEIARLNHMVNDVLNFGRPARMAVETVDLRGLVDETIALVRAQADEQGVEIEVRQDGDRADVQGDRERLKSCLSNIAINALQAMPTGGHLTARVHQTNGTVAVSITDTGVGISEEAQAKIFDAYYSTKQTGFGLGLAVTKKIVEDHKGTIEVESEPDRGTTFTVKLPAANV
ncbi:MAG TPA: ATP-binding protein [Blastocatellia bacterium]|nr:ATP-binding protein [Blastocatellia bacterium]